MTGQRAQSRLREDLEYQSNILEQVSRTFALTIPQLPDDLYKVVANAYLLCRIADTIEDDPDLPLTEKQIFSEQFIQVLEGGVDPEQFAAELYSQLSLDLLQAERELVLNTPRVVRITHSFSGPEQAAMCRCVSIMSRGMAYFQSMDTRHGLRDMPEMDQYCYYVAGVVGEMLTELFCIHCPVLMSQREQLLRLAVSFGQGLQMTNILKDVWEDQRRGACWLPGEVFQQHGFDLKDLGPGCEDPGFRRAYAELIAITRDHLRNALDYTLQIPATEPGMRNFCLWALGMAVLTLRKINAQPDFSSGQQVKITRQSVKATILTTKVAVRQDWLLKLLFGIITRPLPALVKKE
jgi:farnesyl-diphosphate farnesyltransferase